MGEPFWVDDPEFDAARHVLPLGTAGYELDDRRFEMLCDSVLSVPLARDRPLWEIRLAPQMNESRCGLVAKMHHALVDGRSALEVAQLLFDTEPHPGVSSLPVPLQGAGGARGRPARSAGAGHGGRGVPARCPRRRPHGG